MNSMRGYIENTQSSSLARALMLSVSMALAGCGNAPTQPITKVKVANTGVTTVTQYCYSVRERICKTITYKDGLLISAEPGCPSDKYNGAACLDARDTIGTPTTLPEK